jgi:CRISPR-associated protein Csm3
MSLHYIRIERTLVLKSGTRIGGSKEDDDNAIADVPPILRHPITREPYIPGSSLKGKMRSLLEYQYEQDRVMKNGKPCGCMKETCLICKIFGPHIQGRDHSHNLGPTRLIMRDAMLRRSATGLVEFGTYEWVMQLESEEGRSSELKNENLIDRRTGTAGIEEGGKKRAGKRTLERIPAGARFDFRLSLRILGKDDEAGFLAFIEEGMELLKQDAIGGSGSRGYGEIDWE